MKSLRRTGTSTAARTAARSSSEPPNRRPSVSTLITRAPPLGVLAASSAGSGIVASSPFDGLRRLTSAMTPTPGRAQRGIASRGGAAAAARRLISAKSTCGLAGGEVRADAVEDGVEDTLAVLVRPGGPPPHSTVPAFSWARTSPDMLDRVAGRAAVGPAGTGGVRVGGRVAAGVERLPGGPVRSAVAAGPAGRAAYRAPKRGRRRSAGISPSPAASSRRRRARPAAGPAASAAARRRGAARGSARQGGEVRGRRAGPGRSRTTATPTYAPAAATTTPSSRRGVPASATAAATAARASSATPDSAGHEFGARRRDGAGAPDHVPRSP